MDHPPTARRRAPLIPPELSRGDFPPPPADGSLRPLRVLEDRREKASALGETGGFLTGYTHTLNPAIGCVFGQSFCGRYCYAQHETPGRLVEAELGLRWGEYVLLKRELPSALRRDLERAAARPAGHRHHVSKLRVYLSSCTEPCTGPALEITRQCLHAFAAFPVGRVVLQTRSPQVTALRPELEALAGRLLLSFTIESDDDAIWQGIEPPLLPRLRHRRAAIEEIAGWGTVPVCATVSPCVRLRDAESFAEWIALYARLAIVDTFLAGDGRAGARTARTAAPGLLARDGGDWRDESPARRLLALLEPRLGPRAGWSQAGFAALATVPIGDGAAAGGV